MRISLTIAIAGAMLVVTTPFAQAPGDRPAGNPRGTRSVAVGPQRDDRDQPGAGVGGWPQGAAGRRQRRSMPPSPPPACSRSSSRR